MWKSGGVLLLSNNRNSYELYRWLKERDEQVYYYSGKLVPEQILFLLPSLVVSYNYGYLIPENIIRLVKGRIINMHISYLPWNKGADPNFWSFIDNTPKGVTIHELSSSLDQGDILLQKKLTFDEKNETFRSSYEKLNKEIITLFQEHFLEIKNCKLPSYSQKGVGSYHKRSDLIKFMAGNTLNLDSTIFDFKKTIC